MEEAVGASGGSCPPFTKEEYDKMNDATLFIAVRNAYNKPETLG
jgi:hypothetical protein